MENKNIIEIPFGANDSELCECEYTIAEGYEAEIKDGKVIIRKVESEDERIRKDIISYFKTINSIYLDAGEPISRRNVWLAWLEKQGEKKPVEENKGNNGGISPNSNWSEDDEKMLVTVLWHVSYSISNGKETYIKCDTIDWLNKLRERVCPQTHWKPSEAQMIVLNDIIINGHLSNANERILKGLQEQLKSL